MLRLIVRLLLLVYGAMPVAAVVLFAFTFVQIRNDVTPIFDAATTSINNATTALETELHNLGNNFAPLASAMNATRNALQAVLNFIRNTVYTIIDVVNGINLACSIGGTACIGKSINITLPQLVDLSFVDDISAHITTITTQVNTVVNTTTTAITSYATMLTLAVIVLVAWIVLTYVLFFIFMYTGLWRMV